uniref:TIL domain-containing protein n=1 Tax=Anopheles funestus TaxID=62324 RepID=A0A4Y0BF38_ANOFN
MVSIGSIIFVCSLMFCTVTALTSRPSPYCAQQQLNPPGTVIQIPRCRVNEVYSCCGLCVEKTCATLKQTVYCFACAEGCFCKAGYVRKVAGGICVPLNQCFIQG